jgi:hypothetical protein
VRFEASNIDMRRAALPALLIVLPVTLGLRSIQPEARFMDSRRLTGDAVASLMRQGWSVRSSEHHLVGWLILGVQRDCRILVHFPAPSGESTEKFRNLAKSVGPVTYQYRGSISRQFPRLVPVLSWHLQRYAWSLGIAIETAPLIAISKSPSCDKQSPDFGGLSQHLQVDHPLK